MSGNFERKKKHTFGYITLDYIMYCIHNTALRGYIKIAAYRNNDIEIATLPIDQNSDISRLINRKAYIKIATVAITGNLKKKYGKVLK